MLFDQDRSGVAKDRTSAHPDAIGLADMFQQIVNSQQNISLSHKTISLVVAQINELLELAKKRNANHYYIQKPQITRVTLAKCTVKTMWTHRISNCALKSEMWKCPLKIM